MLYCFVLKVRAAISTPMNVLKDDIGFTELAVSWKADNDCLIDDYAKIIGDHGSLTFMELLL